MKISYCSFLAVLGVANVMLAAGPWASATEADDRIVASAKNSHIFKTYLKDDKVEIGSRNGVVTLSGTVSDAFHKSMAGDMVECLAGVRSVDNRIRVNAESPAENSDNSLALKVKTALLFNPKVEGMATEVTAENGTVRLRGVAADAGLKELAGEYARDVDGVKVVKNEITVAPDPSPMPGSVPVKIDDASITAQIKASLSVHRSSQAGKTRVQTRDGLVTLSGSATNAAEKSLITKLVNEVRGVDIVINTMTTGATTESPN